MGSPFIVRVRWLFKLYALAIECSFILSFHCDFLGHLNQINIHSIQFQLQFIAANRVYSSRKNTNSNFEIIIPRLSGSQMNSSENFRSRALIDVDLLFDRWKFKWHIFPVRRWRPAGLWCWCTWDTVQCIYIQRFMRNFRYPISFMPFGQLLACRQSLLATFWRVNGYRGRHSLNTLQMPCINFQAA